MTEPSGFRQVQFSARAKTILTLLIVVGVFAFLYAVRDILGPFLWGLVTAYVVSPIARWVQIKTRLRRGFVIVILYLIFFGLMIGAGVALVPLLVDQLADLAGDIPGIMSSLQADIDGVARLILGQPLNLEATDLDPQILINKLVGNLQDVVSFLTRQALPALVGAADAIFRLVIYMMSTFYFLMESGRMLRAVPNLFPRQYRPEIWQLMRRINRVLGKYVRGQLLLILIMSVTVFIVLTILRVKYSLILALMTGILEAVPVIGAVVSTTTVAIIALVQPTTPFGWSNWTLLIVIVAIFITLRQIEDNIVIPSVMGKLINLHPLLVLFSLFSGQALAGVTGLLLAIPAAAALRLIAEYVYQKLSEPDVLEPGSSAREAHPTPGQVSATEYEEGS